MNGSRSGRQSSIKVVSQPQLQPGPNLATVTLISCPDIQYCTGLIVVPAPHQNTGHMWLATL